MARSHRTRRGLEMPMGKPLLLRRVAVQMATRYKKLGVPTYSFILQLWYDVGTMDDRWEGSQRQRSSVSTRASDLLARITCNTSESTIEATFVPVLPLDPDYFLDMHKIFDFWVRFSPHIFIFFYTKSHICFSWKISTKNVEKSFNLKETVPKVIENTPSHYRTGSEVFIWEVLVLDLHRANGFGQWEAIFSREWFSTNHIPHVHQEGVKGQKPFESWGSSKSLQVRQCAGVFFKNFWSAYFSPTHLSLK